MSTSETFSGLQQNEKGWLGKRSILTFENLQSATSNQGPVFLIDNGEFGS